jgi:hypothetical protein
MYENGVLEAKNLTVSALFAAAFRSIGRGKCALQPHVKTAARNDAN